ncbi:hypothetical protein BE21_53905 [Sorangium cellulosum]|uniref:Uncharacterized protein n=1 Tax=Sorangium cellulosum TaxID=56 RepID=A0A150TE32_SORCE|nr:hypothetical protein BE21_53905 [Sorangium cellulosum]
MGSRSSVGARSRNRRITSQPRKPQTAPSAAPSSVGMRRAPCDRAGRVSRKTRSPPSAAATSAEINRASVAFQKRAV